MDESFSTVGGDYASARDLFILYAQLYYYYMKNVLTRRDVVVRSIYNHVVTQHLIPLEGVGTKITNAEQLIATIHRFLVTDLGMGVSCVWHVDGYSNELSQVSLKISVTTCMMLLFLDPRTNGIFEQAI